MHPTECTGAAKDDTMIVLCSCGTPPKNLSVMPECAINAHNISQLPDCLDKVDLTMPLVASRFLLVMIPGI